MNILKIRNPYYEATKKGETNYIGRAGDSGGVKDYWNNIKPGERILLQLVDDNDRAAENENFEVTVKKACRYETIDDACKSIGIEESKNSKEEVSEYQLMEKGAKKLLPGVQTLSEAIEKYSSFPGYKSRLAKSKFIVIEFEK
jgi:ASC-1-like (ASCH) protein